MKILRKLFSIKSGEDLIEKLREIKEEAGKKFKNSGVDLWFLDMDDKNSRMYGVQKGSVVVGLSYDDQDYMNLIYIPDKGWFKSKGEQGKFKLEGQKLGNKEILGLLRECLVEMKDELGEEKCISWYIEKLGALK